MSRDRLLALAIAAALLAPAEAQSPAPGPTQVPGAAPQGQDSNAPTKPGSGLSPSPDAPNDPTAAPQDPPMLTVLKLVQDGNVQSFLRDDYYEVHLHSGYRLALPELKLEIRGDNALLLLDADEFRRATGQRRSDGLPTRGIPPLEPRRVLSNAAIRERMASTLHAIGRSDGLPSSPTVDQSLELLRYLYCEGGIVVVRDGVEVLRCDRMWISPVDDRVVVENAELRYYSLDQGPGHMFVVRGPRLVREGRRWTGRDVTVSSCTAGKPHAALSVDDVEVIEREGEFEIIARGQTLQVGGTNVLPLPNAHVFTGSQDEFPIKRVRAGYSQQLGYQGEVVFGLPWNRTGGAIHEWLTGRPAHEFRGEWQAGIGWIQERGVPLEGLLRYRAGKLYEGQIEAFWLDDSGSNIREILTRVDGSPVTEQTRTLLHTQNRIRLGATTNLDLVAYKMSDEAVYSEFFPADYRTLEVPETSTYLHHGDGNRLLTVGTRFNLNDFSYRDDRALADRFVEELPVVTYQWLSQPIGTTPWDTPIVVDFGTDIGERRSVYDDFSTLSQNDRTLRLDQLAEVSAPFPVLGLNLRPYVNARGTWWDNSVDGDDIGRVATETGFQLGTSFRRTWSWLDGEDMRAVRHVMSPKLTYRNRFHAEDRTADVYTFDATDTLTEQQLVRVELRNQLQRMEKVGLANQPRDFLFFDVAQDLFPDKARDNQGDGLGLLYYDFLVRLPRNWSVFETSSLAVYGDHDWRNGLRTFDGELQFGPIAGVGWGFEYRTDALTKGSVLVIASTQLRERWGIFGVTQRDIETDEWLAYAVGLSRNDHDWSIRLTVVYNPFAEDTTFRIDFQPNLGGLNRPQRDRLGTGQIIGPAGAPH